MGRAVFGQSYQLAGQNEYNTDFYRTSGLATDDSDFVGGLYIQALSNLGFSAQSRFDESTLDIKRTDLGTFAHYGPAQLRVNYADVTRRARPRPGEPREEIVTAGVSGAHRGLVAARQSSATTSRPSDDHRRLGLRYQDDCFMLDVTYQRSFIQDQDIKPDRALPRELRAEISRHLPIRHRCRHACSGHKFGIAEATIRAASPATASLPQSR